MGSIRTFTQENEVNSANDVQLDDLKSYLLGAMHDGTVRQRTLRISQREEEYVVFLRSLILAKGKRAWTYREGRTRNLFVVEFSRTLLDGHRLRTRKDIIHYVRGYFDAEGGGCESRSIRSVSVFRTEESVGLGRTPQLALRTQSDVWKNPQSELPSGSRLLAVLRVAPVHRKVREASRIMAPKEGSMARRSAQP